MVAWVAPLTGNWGELCSGQVVRWMSGLLCPGAWLCGQEHAEVFLLREMHMHSYTSLLPTQSWLYGTLLSHIGGVSGVTGWSLPLLSLPVCLQSSSGLTDISH